MNLPSLEINATIQQKKEMNAISFKVYAGHIKAKLSVDTLDEKK